MEKVLGLMLIAAVIGAYALVRPSLITHLTTALFMAIITTSAQAQVITLLSGPGAVILQWWVLGFLDMVLNAVVYLLLFRAIGNKLKNAKQRENPFWQGIGLPERGYATNVDNPPAWENKLLRRKQVAQAEKENRDNLPSAEDRGWNRVEF